MDITSLQKIANSSRLLAIDAIQTANSGHPGLPLGAAEIGAYLYGYAMNYYSKDPLWINRDRFVLSAGHGSMFLYSYLHLAGYDVSLEDIKNFRKIGSKCAGHPEFGLTPGVDATSGPLGQGVAMAVGMAIAETMASATYNTEKFNIFDHYTYILAGDGDLSEGVSSEACSLAGHLQLGKLIMFYDSNKISIDGGTEVSFTEDVHSRYLSYGWQVLSCSMYDFEAINNLTQQAKECSDKPTLIILESVIGKGAPNKQGTPDVHGSPLGEEELRKTKAYYGEDPDKKFYVDPDVHSYFEKKEALKLEKYSLWQEMYTQWKQENPEKATELEQSNHHVEITKEMVSNRYKIDEAISTRDASLHAIGSYSKLYTNLVGGSADLSGPNRTLAPHTPIYSAKNRSGKYIHYGVREFAMATIANGLFLYGHFRPFIGTFLAFSDYFRPALRLSALMELGVIYVLTHDSIYVGEDGPTHQPIEHLAALRAIPNVSVQRPADAEETIAIWDIALTRTKTPTLLVLSRQGLPVFKKDDPNWFDNIKKGAYIAKEATSDLKRVVVATGSEVSLVLQTIANSNDSSFDNIRVISMPDREMFYKQSHEYRSRLIPDNVEVLVVEAGVKMGWERIANENNILSVDHFGASGPAEELGKQFNFTQENIIQMLNNL